MEALQITAHLAGSIALARPEDVALDGLLAAQVLRRFFGNDFYLLPDPKEVLFFARLPLDMRGQPGAHVAAMQTGDVWQSAAQGVKDESLWYWACSAAQATVKGRDTQYWNKRFDTQAALSDSIDFGGRVEKIIIENGQYKAYHMPLPTLVTDALCWYAYGDRDELLDLLSPIAAIGKKRAQGNGAVLRWSVEPMAEDCSEWRGGMLMRPIPGPLCDLSQVRPLNMSYTAFRGPQWHPANQCLCVVAAQREVAL